MSVKVRANNAVESKTILFDYVFLGGNQYVADIQRILLRLISLVGALHDFGERNAGKQAFTKRSFIGGIKGPNAVDHAKLHLWCQVSGQLQPRSPEEARSDVMNVFH